MEMAALTYNMAMLSAALLICSLLNNKKNDFTLAQKGMLLLAKAVYTGIGSEGVSNQPAEDAFSILDSLYQEAYKSRGLTYVVSPRGKYNTCLHCCSRERFISDQSIPGAVFKGGKLP